MPGGVHLLGNRASAVVATTTHLAASLFSFGICISTRPCTGCSAQFLSLKMISVAALWLCIRSRMNSEINGDGIFATCFVLLGLAGTRQFYQSDRKHHYQHDYGENVI